MTILSKTEFARSDVPGFSQWVKTKLRVTKFFFVTLRVASLGTKDNNKVVWLCSVEREVRSRVV